MLNSTNCLLLTQGISNLDLRSKVDIIILSMGVILTIINSKKKVRVAEFNEFCIETSLAVIRVPWIKLTPSVHIGLGHSSELIESNNETGLLNLTETGLKANNKFLRQYRSRYARKTSQIDNLTDCLNRIWDKSDPMVMKLRERVHCSHCKAQGHTIRSCAELKRTLSGCKTEFDSVVSLLPA